MAKKIPTRNVNKSRGINYLKKAQQFSRAMHESLEKKDWDASGLNAVHCAISANDAVLVSTKGVRSSSARHSDSVELLEALVTVQGVKTSSGQLKRVIAKKSLIEYEDRMFRENEARDAVKNAERFLTWAEKVVPKE